jgi:tRNA-(ms[2]io[6]A)-hydroxylase
MEKFKLGLNLPTDPRWVNIAEKNIADILTDHAYCEQKAASSCISMIIKFSDKQELVDLMTPVVAEEWSHFERVLEKMKERGFTLGRPRNDAYVKELSKAIKKGGNQNDQLMESLLVNALIEARSCERFRLLWLHIPDDDLKKFYYELMVSEASHYKNFLALAKHYCGEEQVTARWNEFLAIEADIINNMEVRGDRMH